MPDATTIYAAAQLRLLRKQRGLTQQALATALGVTFQMIQKYEKGTCRLSLPTLLKLAQILQTPPTTFLPTTPQPTPPTPKTFKQTVYLTLTEESFTLTTSPPTKP